jgi:hypothetical protein
MTQAQPAASFERQYKDDIRTTPLTHANFEVVLGKMLDATHVGWGKRLWRKGEDVT